MSFAPISSSVNEKVFQNPKKLLQASSTLLRLSKLDKIFSKSSQNNRLNVLEKIKAILNSSIKQAMDIQSSFNKGENAFADRIAELYALSATSVEDLPHRIEQIRRDLKSISFAPPLIPSAKGVEGPTLLVRYHRNREHKYVVKLSNWEELLSAQVYSAFALGFHDSQIAFAIPKSIGIDLIEGDYRAINGEQIPCHIDISKKLEEEFCELVKLYDKEIIDKEDKPLLLYSELIEGENLVDFFADTYESLTIVNKNKFFEQLGRISCLDLLLGNFDRLVQIELNEKNDYEFEDLPANLGNIMVSLHDDDTLKFYLIDNGLQALDIADNEEGDAVDRGKAYLEFLQNFLIPSSNQIPILAQKVFKTVNEALDSKFKGDDDASQIKISSIQAGFVEMLHLLTTELIPAWESKSESLKLKEQIKIILPSLGKAVEDRVNLFKQISKS